MRNCLKKSSSAGPDMTAAAAGPVEDAASVCATVSHFSVGLAFVFVLIVRRILFGSFIVGASVFRP